MIVQGEFVHQGTGDGGGGAVFSPELIDDLGAYRAFHQPLVAGGDLNHEPHRHHPGHTHHCGGLDIHGRVDVQFAEHHRGDLLLRQCAACSTLRAGDHLADVLGPQHGDGDGHHGARPLVGTVDAHLRRGVRDDDRLLGDGADGGGTHRHLDDGALRLNASAFETDPVTHAELFLGEDEEAGEEVGDDGLRTETNRRGGDGGGDGGAGQ